VDVVGVVCGGVEGIGAQYLAVGGDDERVEGGEFVRQFGDAGGLFEVEVLLAGKLRDGGWDGLAAASFAGVWL
jgi:hypothetical protein